MTIAHRLRTIIDYDRVGALTLRSNLFANLLFVQVMLLDQGIIAEFDKPATLLADSSSKFHSLCKATGKSEFAVLKKMSGL